METLGEWERRRGGVRPRDGLARGRLRPSFKSSGHCRSSGWMKAHCDGGRGHPPLMGSPSRLKYWCTVMSARGEGVESSTYPTLGFFPRRRSSASVPRHIEGALGYLQLTGRVEADSDRRSSSDFHVHTPRSSLTCFAYASMTSASSLRDLYASSSSSWSFESSASANGTQPSMSAPEPAAADYQWSPRPARNSIYELTPSLDLNDPVNVKMSILFKGIVASVFLQYGSTAIAMPWEVGKMLLQVQWVPRDAEEVDVAKAEEQFVQEEEEVSLSSYLFPLPVIIFRVAQRILL